MERSILEADFIASSPSSSIGHRLNSRVNVNGLIFEYSLNSSNSVANGKDGLLLSCKG